MAVTTIESPALTAYPGWSSTRERGRPARILIPANSLPSAATPLQSAPNPPLRGRLFHVPLRDARAPSCRGFVRAGRPRSRVGSFFTSRNASTARMVEKSVQCTKSPMKHRPTGGLCAGETPALPGGHLLFLRAATPLHARAPGVGAGRPRLLLPPARPLAGPSRASSNALVALWPFFVALRGYLFLSLGVLRGCPWWVLYVS